MERTPGRPATPAPTDVPPVRSTDVPFPAQGHHQTNGCKQDASGLRTAETAGGPCRHPRCRQGAGSREPGAGSPGGGACRGAGFRSGPASGGGRDGVTRQVRCSRPHRPRTARRTSSRVPASGTSTPSARPPARPSWSPSTARARRTGTATGWARCAAASPRTRCRHPDHAGGRLPSRRAVRPPARRVRVSRRRPCRPGGGRCPRCHRGLPGARPGGAGDLAADVMCGTRAYPLRRHRERILPGQRLITDQSGRTPWPQRILLI